MKKVFITRLIVLFALLVSMPVSAYDFIYGGIYYNISGDEAYVTRGGSKYQGRIEIPSQVTYNGKTYHVTSIGENAFYQCSGLTSVTIPNSVTSIDEQAFDGCSGLTSVTIPNSVTSIGDMAFQGCSGLSSITIPNSVTSITSFSFAYCSGLSSIKVESGNTKYDSRDNCNAIIETASNTLKTGCKNTTIPNSVTSIGSSAFCGCSGLTSITIPNSVTSINSSAGLSGCNGLTSIKVESGNTKYDSRDNCNAIIETASNTLIAGCKNTTIPNSVTSIGSHAFSGCSGLTSITISNSVTSIGDYAFMHCSGLTSFTIPNSVTSIGRYAFSGCSGLTSFTIPNNVTSIGMMAFGDCSGLTSINVESGNPQYDSRNNCNAIIDSNNQLIIGCKNTIIPNSVTSIGSSAFCDCSGLTSVTIPNSVTSIGDNAFYDCSGLTSVTIPNSVTSIGEYAFTGCSGLTSVTIPNSVTSIGRYAFHGTEWYNNQPNGLVYAGKIAYKFKGEMPANMSVNIKDGTLGITAYAFSGCSGLTSVTIPNSVTSIGDNAFSGTAWYNNQPNGLVYAGKIAYKFKGEMPANMSVNIKDGTLGITASAFWGCSGLTSVTIPNSVTSIGRYAFSDCSGLTSVTIPNSVTSIGDWTFHNCSGLTSVTIGNSVTSIGEYAFYKCSSLTSINIPNSVTSIGNDAFSNCSGLTSVTIPNSVTSIGSYAFYRCSGLTSITIPNSVTSIGGYAFNGCRGLTAITSEIEKPLVINDETFSSVTYNVAELVVPFGTKAAYQTTGGWKKFTMITEAPDKDAVTFTIDGISYQGSNSEKNVIVKSVDANKTWLEIPASVSYDGITYQVAGIDNDVIKGSSMAALIWDVEAVLPNNAFSNASIGSNFLLYVKSSSYAPSSVKNVVVNGTAQTIVLSDDGGQFYCPQAFTARSISYTHNYSMETDIGKAKGWETLALPFDVQKISHSTRGEIVPFPSYNSSSIQKPFWLANFSGNGFRRTAAVLANEPYIIAMPNSSSYRNEYNLAGDVTFSADNVQVPKTPSFSGNFVPAFATVAKSSSVYALNVNNRNVKYSGSYDAGSRFIANLRDVRPFEAYISSSSSTRGIYEIHFDDGTTDMLDILLSTDESQEVSIHTLSGQLIIRTTQRDFDAVWQQLPKGVYIINGKKWIK